MARGYQLRVTISDETRARIEKFMVADKRRKESDAVEALLIEALDVRKVEAPADAQ